MRTLYILCRPHVPNLYSVSALYVMRLFTSSVAKSVAFVLFRYLTCFNDIIITHVLNIVKASSVNGLNNLYINRLVLSLWLKCGF